MWRGSDAAKVANLRGTLMAEVQGVRDQLAALSASVGQVRAPRAGAFPVFYLQVPVSTHMRYLTKKY